MRRDPRTSRGAEGDGSVGAVSSESQSSTTVFRVVRVTVTATAAGVRVRGVYLQCTMPREKVISKGGSEARARDDVGIWQLSLVYRPRAVSLLQWQSGLLRGRSIGAHVYDSRSK